MKYKYPKAWADFEKWFGEQHYNFAFYYNVNSGEGCFVGLDFEMQLGVYLKYIDEKKLIVGEVYPYKLYNFSDSLKQAIEQAFKTREEQLNK